MSFNYFFTQKVRKLNSRTRRTSLPEFPLVQTPQTPEYARFCDRLDSLSLDNLSPPDPVSQPKTSSESCTKAKQVLTGTNLLNLGDQTSAPAKSTFRFSDCKLRRGRNYQRSKINSDSTVLTSSKVSHTTNMIPVSQNSAQSNLEQNTVIPLERISKLVNNVVPIFHGDRRNNSANDLQIFLDCCKQVGNALSSQQEKDILIPLLKTKLRGEAYDLVKYLKINTLNELESLLTNTFTPQKSINDIVSDIRRCIQLPGETVSSFGTKINMLLVECRRAINNKYPERNQALIKEIEEEACYTFKTGIISPIIRQILLGNTDKSLDTLIKIAQDIEKTEERQIQSRHIGISWQSPTRLPPDALSEAEIAKLRDLLHYKHTFESHSGHFNQEPITNMVQNKSKSYSAAPSTSQILLNLSSESQHEAAIPNIGASYAAPQGNTNIFSVPEVAQRTNLPVNSRKFPKKCSFCNRIGHTYQECRTRQRTPFCTACHNYGHIPQTCPRANRSRTFHNPEQRHTVKCDWCARPSHTLEQCRAKKSWEERNSAAQQRPGN